MSSYAKGLLIGIGIGMSAMGGFFIVTVPEFNYSNEYEVCHAQWKVFAAEVELQNLKEAIKYERGGE